MAYRSRSAMGAETVRRWAAQLPLGGSVLDLGCGHGLPITQVLIEEGLRPYGIDASATMIAAFRLRHPHLPVEHNRVECSSLFHRRFDGVIAWGLLFLLHADLQAKVIHQIGAALERGGRFLFTAPAQACFWTDQLTGNMSRSLGADGYLRLIESAGLELEEQREDEGQNHYYIGRRIGPG